jgi:hypothetical protein
VVSSLVATPELEVRTMVSPERRYEFVTQQIRYHNEKIIQAFSLFVKLATAIVGGVVWLVFQPQEGPTWIPLLASGVFILVGVAVIILIAANLKAWLGYRAMECKLNPSAPGTSWTSIISEAVMILVIFVSMVLFTVFAHALLGGGDMDAGIIISVVVGGLITLAVAFFFHWWTSLSERNRFEVLARFLESFAEATLKGKAFQVDFTRDKKGNPTNVRVTIEMEPVKIERGDN